MADFAQLMAEEVLLLQNDFTDILISLFYSEKSDKLSMSCESAGPPNNPLKENLTIDDIGLKLILGKCDKIEYSYEDNKNKLLLQIKDA